MSIEPASTSAMLDEPRCFTRKCKHYDGVRGGCEATEHHVCPAFPNGIPNRIAYGKDTHLTVAPDQVGRVVFESR